VKQLFFIAINYLLIFYIHLFTCEKMDKKEFRVNEALLCGEKKYC
jgi:hypothetical protein